MRSCGTRPDDSRRSAGRVLVVLVIAAVAIRLLPDPSLSGTSLRVVLNTLLGGGAILALFLMMRGLVLHQFLFDRQWRQHLLHGGVIGLLSLTAYLAAAAYAGAVETPAAVAPGRWFRVPLIAAEVLFAAAAVQVAVTGLLLEILKRAYGSLLAVLTAATGFSLVAQWGPVIDGERLLGVFLLLTLLAVLRLLQGSVYFGIGLLFGLMVVERMRGILWEATPPFSPDAASAQFFIAHGEVQTAPLFWLMTGAALLASLAILAYRGEAPAPQDNQTIPASLKRIYPLAQPCLLAPLDLWLSRLHQARWRIGWKYLPKLAFTLSVSAVNTLLSLPERLLLPWLLRNRPIPDPIFIVGVHRSGTTHLHNLLSLDRRLATPRLYQVLNPHGFLFSGWLLLPLLVWIPPRRPMDNMSLSLLSPAEEEYAMLNSSRLSPYWGFVFPQQSRHYDRFIYADDWSGPERERWLQLYRGFLRRLVLFSRRRPLLKSPYNTARIALLKRVFPNARFIHIRRHPHAVYRSNMRFAEHGIAVHQLQDADSHSPYLEQLPEHHLRMERIWQREKESLGPGRMAELRFEELERDPVGAIERVYGQLELAFTADLSERIRAYAASLEGYRKNRFDVSPDTEAEPMPKRLTPLLAIGGYERKSPD